MKQILTVILTSMMLACVGQSKLDSLVFSKINKLRTDNKLSPIQWDQSCWKDAHKQSINLVDLNRYENDFNRYVIKTDTLIKVGKTCAFLYISKDNKTTEERYAEEVIVKGLSVEERKKLLDKNLKSGSVSCSLLDYYGGLVNMVVR